MPPAMPWGGLENLMLDWFERIDYRRCCVTLAVTPEGKELYSKQFLAKGINIEIVEFPFDFSGGVD